MTLDAIAEVEGLLAGRVGLRLDPALRARLTRCIEEEAIAARMTVSEYALRVAADPDLFQLLLNRVTVQQTAFFRDPQVFEAIATELLPKLDGPVVAWSAGCANGQEAYSLAMILAESRVRQWTVLASDISTSALGRTRAARYTGPEVEGLDDRRRLLHMTPIGSRWEVNRELRDRVRVVHHNLISDASPLLGVSCQIILCRNVLIYFSPTQLTAVLERLARWLSADGHLFLGASESLWQLTNRFRLKRVGQAFAYVTEGYSEERRREVRTITAERRRPPTVSQLLAGGEAAAGAGDFRSAVELFRRATLLDPNHPLAHYQLALCLERDGRGEPALQALRNARAAFERCDMSEIEAVLEGYRPEEFIRVIDLHLGGGR